MHEQSKQSGLSASSRNTVYDYRNTKVISTNDVRRRKTTATSLQAGVCTGESLLPPQVYRGRCEQRSHRAWTADRRTQVQHGRQYKRPRKLVASQLVPIRRDKCSSGSRGGHERLRVDVSPLDATHILQWTIPEIAIQCIYDLVTGR